MLSRTTTSNIACTCLTVFSDIHADRPHSFICESLDAEVRVRTSDRTLPGPISCSADVLPFSFTYNLRPNQYLQYQRLKAAVSSQLRFDTMVRQRPFESPRENPRAWWKYSIACVTSRPTSRPWQDVKRIGRSRIRYIELVAKKNAERSVGVGFHAGLSSKHSAELLVMEDSLPIEALLAFHLVALRRAFEAQQRSYAPRNSSSSDMPIGVSSMTKSKSSGRFRILRASSKKKPQVSLTELELVAPPPSLVKPSLVSVDERTTASTMSLLEAMTLRLGKKVWVVDWKLHDATVSTVFRRARDDKPVLQFVLRASGDLRSFGLGKRDFSFAVTQCDVLHGTDKVLFFGSAEGETFAEESGETYGFADMYGFDPGQQLSSQLSSGRVRPLAGPDLSTPSSFLELPPLGTVCRVVAGKDQDTFKLSISAHPATLVLTTSLSDGITEFFVDQSSDLQTDLTQHIRNAATPLARKAQLALLSPASLALHLNIAAPKVWVPLVSNNSEGSLFLDAGTLRMASSKDEGETEVHWKVQARDIGAHFVRGMNSSRFGGEPHLYLRSYGAAPIGRAETAVVKPFSIVASSRILRDVIQGVDASFADPIRNVEVVVSPICLNLVDAEILARLIGKLYSRGLHRVRRRVLATESTDEHRKSGGPLQVADFQLPFDDFKHSELPRTISVKIEKVEMALEGHSKQLTGSDERSLASLDTLLQEYAPPTRAYLVEVFQISLKKSRLRHTEITRLSITDASIVRLRDVSLYTPLKVRRDMIESENCILVRASERSNETPVATSLDKGDQQGWSSSDENPRAEVFRASLLHNGVTHLDEVEVSLDAV
jgi:Vacuolar sorting-associated protein 13, N-terminal